VLAVVVALRTLAVLVAQAEQVVPLAAVVAAVVLAPVLTVVLAVQAVLVTASLLLTKECNL
jgi:hypothetical protein